MQWKTCRARSCARRAVNEPLKFRKSICTNRNAASIEVQIPLQLSLKAQLTNQTRTIQSPSQPQSHEHLAQSNSSIFGPCTKQKRKHLKAVSGHHEVAFHQLQVSLPLRAFRDILVIE
mmetsp:Transcript_1982/g.4418  ORF Transcript_1982/g.4418 Transcript_1982/m.4418 type:complete len:118 (-) Transcript_1982:1990-2343(-)